MGYIQNDTQELVGKGWLRVIWVIAVLIAIYLIGSLTLSIWPFNMVKKVANSDAVIANYEWFYDQYNAIQAQKANIEAMPTDARERTGMIMVMNNAIAEYNSRSKQITRSAWKSDTLPYQIPLGGE